ncbi:MAG: hydroxymethylbilane synthase [Actinobacteria bacterium]|nr:hydroxymethylbilane synthase [Actinomycetota bacterium]
MNTKQTIRIGTRGSRLALVQTEIICKMLLQQQPDLHIEQVIIKTRGDKILDVSLSKIGDKGLFVKEIETALLRNEIDIAVHSMKDLPTESPAELTIAAVAPREDAHDVLVSKKNRVLDDLPQGAIVATSSLRRGAQLLAHRRDLRLTDIRGNVETRLRKFGQGDMDAVVLAKAGLKRLGLEEHISQVLPFDVMLPAPAQGAIGIQIRKDDDVMALVQLINDAVTFQTVTAERAFLQTLEGGCQTPIATFCQIHKETLTIEGKVLSLDGLKLFSAKLNDRPEMAAEIGVRLANELLDLGAARILEEIRVR